MQSHYCQQLNISSDWGYVSDIPGTYQVIDDVWKAADFLQCIFIQSTDESSVDKSSFADILISNQITHAFVPTMFDINGMILPQETSIFPTASGCDLTNGPLLLHCLPVDARVSACRQPMRSTQTTMKLSWNDRTNRIQNLTPIYLSTPRYPGLGCQESSLLPGSRQLVRMLHCWLV
jgi:hypothetical protein